MQFQVLKAQDIQKSAMSLFNNQTDKSITNIQLSLSTVRDNQKIINERFMQSSLQNSSLSQLNPQQSYKNTKIFNTRKLLSQSIRNYKPQEFKQKTITLDEQLALTQQLSQIPKQTIVYPQDETFQPQIYSQNFQVKSKVQQYIDNKEYQQSEKQYKKYIKSDKQIDQLLHVKDSTNIKTIDLQKTRQIQQSRIQNAQEKRKQQNKVIDDQKLKEEMQECTFKPQISQASRDMCQGIEDDIFQRFDGYQKKHQIWVQKQQNIQRQKEIEQCKPIKQYVKAKNNEKSINIYDRLYYDSKIREMKIQQNMQNQEEVGEAEMVRSMHDSDLYDRLYEDAKQQQLKQQQNNLSQTQQKLKVSSSQTFKQQQNKSDQLAQQSDLFDVIQQYKEIKQLTETSLRHTTQESNQICKEKMNYFLDQLYMKIDFTKDHQSVAETIQTIVEDQSVSDKIIQYLQLYPYPTKQQFIFELSELLPKEIQFIYSRIKFL